MLTLQGALYLTDKINVKTTYYVSLGYVKAARHRTSPGYGYGYRNATKCRLMSHATKSTDT